MASIHSMQSRFTLALEMNELSDEFRHDKFPRTFYAYVQNEIHTYTNSMSWKFCTYNTANISMEFFDNIL